MFFRRLYLYIEKSAVPSCKILSFTEEATFQDGQAIWELSHKSCELKDALVDYSISDESDLQATYDILIDSFSPKHIPPKHEFQVFRNRVQDKDCYWLVNKNKRESYLLVFSY